MSQHPSQGLSDLIRGKTQKRRIDCFCSRIYFCPISHCGISVWRWYQALLNRASRANSDTNHCSSIWKYFSRVIIWFSLLFGPLLSGLWFCVSCTCKQIAFILLDYDSQFIRFQIPQDLMFALQIVFKKASSEMESQRYRFSISGECGSSWCWRLTVDVFKYSV